MPGIFVSKPGTVAVFMEPDSILLGRIKFEGSEDMKFMVSGVDYKQSVDAQFQTSLERDIYAYVFGDNMGDVLVHGRAYFQCPKDNSATFTSANGLYDSASGKQVNGQSDGSRTGFDDIVDLYAKKRMSQYFPPVTVTVGKKTMQGYLTSLLVKAVGLSDEPSGLVYDFTVTINTLPSVGSGGSGEAPAAAGANSRGISSANKP